MVTTRLFEEPIEAVESSEQTQVPLATRLLYCIGASLVAIVPSVATTYSGLQIARFFRTLTDAESARATRILGNLSVYNMPLIFALGVSALLAFGIGIALATDSQRRKASVGLPFAIGVPILGVTPAVLLWWVESTMLEVLAGKQINTPPTVVAETISNLLFWAIAASMVAPALIFICAIVSLCIPARLRMNTLSMPRAFVWGAVGMLLLVLAGVFFALI